MTIVLIRKLLSENLSVLSGLVLFSLLLPFLVLSFYTVPSTDDYAFTVNTIEYGLIEAQIQSYLNWTGRYSSVLLLSLHPLVIDFLLGYRIVALLTFLFSLHAIYFFLKKTFGFSEEGKTLLICVALLYVYLSSMPELVQGFYWMPGTITYQLGNILLLYFVGNIVNLQTEGIKHISWIRGIINALLIVITCGLSETSMVVMCYVSVSLWLYSVLKTKRLNPWLTSFVVLSALCAFVVFLAPGNASRIDHDASHSLSPDVLTAVLDSLGAALQVIANWVLSWTLIIFSFVVFLFFSIIRGFHVWKKWPLRNVVLGAVWLFGLIAVSVFPVQYVFGDLVPVRTINITYWLFLCAWIIFLMVIHQNLARIYSNHVNRYFSRYLFAGILLLLFTSLDKSDRLYIAWDDILSGRGSELAAQYEERDRIMKECSDEICVYPKYTVFPKTIFNEDFDSDGLSYFETRFAHYYGHLGARSEFAKPEFLQRFFVDMENDQQSMLGNQGTRSDEFSWSGQFSSQITSDSQYSVSYTIPIGELEVENIHLLSTVELSVFSLCPDQNCNADLVFVVVNSSGETLAWHGKQLYKHQKEGWVKTTLKTQLSDYQIQPTNTLMMYVWNRSESTVFIDDMELFVY